MRVLLIFPPQCRPLQPQLALPVVKAELLRRGHECRVIDLNLRFYEHVLSPSTLQTASAAIASQLCELEGRPKLIGSDFVKYTRMASALVRSDYLIEVVEEAVEVFRSEAFYDIGNFQWARKVIEEALDLYGSAYGHLDLGLSQLRMRYGTTDPNQIAAATEDPSENPFIGLLSAWAVEEIEAFSPEVIGISVGLDEQLIPAFTLARELRTCANWSGMLVAGGSMITRLIEDLKSDSYTSRIFDRYLAFESEAEFADMIDAADGKKACSHEDFAHQVPDFDDLPLKRYFLPDTILTFLGSRGCSYGRCRYCSHYKTYGRYAYGDPVAAATVLKQLATKYGVRHFYLVDEALEPKYGTQLAGEIERQGMDIRWMIFARMHRAWTPAVVKTIARAGCIRLIFGIDGATEALLSSMDKKTDLVHAERIFQACKDEGIAVQTNYIVGFPGETRSQAADGFQFVRRQYERWSTMGSAVAYANFVLVRGAAWDQMRIRRVHTESNKRFALQFAFEVEDGLTQQEAQGIAYTYQTDADRELRSSWRFPILREFAFLYRDRFGPSGKAPRTTSAPEVKAKISWFCYDVYKMSEDIRAALGELQVRPQEYISKWWRLASEGSLSTSDGGGMNGVQADGYFSENSFEIPLVSVYGTSGSATAARIRDAAQDIASAM